MKTSSQNNQFTHGAFWLASLFVHPTKTKREKAKPLPYNHDKQNLLRAPEDAHAQLQSEKDGEIQRKIILFGWPNRHLTNEIEMANGQLN